MNIVKGASCLFIVKPVLPSRVGTYTCTLYLYILSLFIYIILFIINSEHVDIFDAELEKPVYQQTGDFIDRVEIQLKLCEPSANFHTEWMIMV